MKQERAMKVGFIGTGWMAEIFAQTIQKLEGMECYAVASRSLERAETFRREFGFAKAYGSDEEMADDPDVDLVYVVTPPSCHYDEAKICIKRGKSVMVEKTFVVNSAQAKNLVDLARKNKVLLTEAIWTKFMPSRDLITTAVNSGVIGEVIGAQANLAYNLMGVKRLQNLDLAGGALFDVGVYPINFITMVLGFEIEQITSTCVKTKTGVDGSSYCTFKYKNGCIAAIYNSMCGYSDQNGIVYGTDGYLVAKNINNVEKIEIYNKERNCIQQINVPGQINGYEYELYETKHALESGEIECSSAPLEETVKVMEIMDEMRRQWNLVYPFEKR